MILLLQRVWRLKNNIYRFASKLLFKKPVISGVILTLIFILSVEFIKKICSHKKLTSEPDLRKLKIIAISDQFEVMLG
jgi:hypothetical protein